MKSHKQKVGRPPVSAARHPHSGLRDPRLISGALINGGGALALLAHLAGLAANLG
jgi:hypothetical protein